MEDHKIATAEIAARVKHLYALQRPFRIYHGSTNSTRHSQYTRDNTVDTSKLSHVLKVDTYTRTALVEPNVPMDSLVAATMECGLIPPVVMEFPGITVGGGFSGTSAESSSFRHSFFDRTVISVEIVLADGKIVTASAEENHDLFRGAASSFGTLGVITLVQLRLLEAKTYVELTYHPVNSIIQAVQKIEEATMDASIDYLDGMLFSKDCGVICTGRLTNDLKSGIRLQGFLRSTDPWFYLHAKRLLKTTNGPVTEAIPLTDYLFRYDRGGFWVGMYAFKYFITPFNRITRWVLDYFMHTRVMYHAMHQSGHSELYIIQDVAIPYQKADDFVEFLDQSFGRYPLWLCPLLQTNESPMSPRALLFKEELNSASKMILNFGVWGPGPRGRDEFVQANRKLEQKVLELGGKKWLYAHAYYTEDEFWSIYKRDEYDTLRIKYHANYLPSIFDKVRVDFVAEKQAINKSRVAWLLALFWSIWPLSGLYGVLHTLLKEEYLMLRQAPQKFDGNHIKHA